MAGDTVWSCYYGMWVPVAVWRLSELLYPCYYFALLYEANALCYECLGLLQCNRWWKSDKTSAKTKTEVSNFQDLSIWACTVIGVTRVLGARMQKQESPTPRFFWGGGGGARDPKIKCCSIEYECLNKMAIERKSCCRRLYFRGSFSKILCSLIIKYVFSRRFCVRHILRSGATVPICPLVTPLETMKIDVHK